MNAHFLSDEFMNFDLIDVENAFMKVFNEPNNNSFSIGNCQFTDGTNNYILFPPTDLLELEQIFACELNALTILNNCINGEQ